MKKNGDWLIKETIKIFDNDFFSISLDKVINPKKQDDNYATIEFKNSVAVIALDEDENVFLTKQFRYAVEGEKIEVVAGAVEDEDFLSAAKRELKEELGIIAEEWTNLGEIISNTSITKDTKALFLAQKLSFSKPETEATEQIRLIKMSLIEAFEKVMSNEITHDNTCLLILKTAEFIRRNG